VFVRENELLTLTGLVLLHAAHSTWMVVILLGLDGRVHLGRIIASGWTQLPTPGFLAVASVALLYAGRLFLTRLLTSGDAQCTSVAGISTAYARE